MEFLNTDFLKDDEIKLILQKTTEENKEKNWVPSYIFDICDLIGNKMGQCDLRIGYNEGLYYGGHIGYQIDEKYRGHHYSAKACKLLFKLAKMHNMDYLYITTSPDNKASNKICKYINGEFLGIFELPKDNDMRVIDGETHKCIYKFEL
ncbi:MAG: GNAT family N-acetyltransferase [Peptoniphilaceae bacterium]|uniref:GNAT family N-acetyltransferase n=1 Tax=Parvimonas sp. TaxID=1944660 RepID=UPI0025DDEF70|nr:GNAT family N-acetyltransferase [Parvimonas sp.]MCI5997390.1 GNAT family N-acetyltransferase [Parvimonas sp.]MDD7764768.1 GNAT family N-acetyltransferase [Peptoniphilaceae bacterium]MDY3050762.1 GNAT family N-acetyltransferase [Parvimonas sp.]